MEKIFEEALAARVTERSIGLHIGTQTGVCEMSWLVGSDWRAVASAWRRLPGHQGYIVYVHQEQQQQQRTQRC